jgi:hypothetical protein
VTSGSDDGRHMPSLTELLEPHRVDPNPAGVSVVVIPARPSRSRIGAGPDPGRSRSCRAPA